MSNYVEINGDPDYIRARGAMLAASGESFDSKAQSLVSRIAGLEGGAPWGADEYGTQFLNDGQGGGYHGTKDIPDGKTFNEYVKTASTQLGPRMSHTGNAIVNAMTGYQFADLDNSANIQNA